MENLLSIAVSVFAFMIALLTLAHARSALGFFLFWLPISAAFFYCSVFVFVPHISLGVVLVGFLATFSYGLATDDATPIGP